METDLILVERAKKGDLKAFSKLVEQNKKLVYYLAYDMMNNREDAEDISQEVFIKAYKSLANFRGDSKFSSWLYRITMNTCLSLRRNKSSKIKSGVEDIEDYLEHNLTEMKVSYEQNPERFAERGFMKKNIDKALNVLSPREKSVFVLRNMNDLPFGEISEILKLTLGTVRSLNFRALKKLQNQLSFYKNTLSVEEING
ncbi:MAG: sigma-70 family RNA polymerase sigma factor [Bacteroidetes bacterium]|nr:sigma-70 family RNA polymerase sigma factor [Bacteroidota bacterium]MBU1116492.1 sigma-70 family RNA polymerase sigma factor [Bacteroidota bacterium]MBU1797146.1 sigma-70 family RNA polymerase sigma factor [Bacteroidota bacterium]